MPQFTSAYTDLFTAGVFTSAFYLWLAALRRREGSALGGAGVALAFGAKGTMFYLAPGALLVAAWLGWRERAAWPAWRRTLLAGGLAAAVLVAPGMVRNVRTYGGPFGPAAAMAQQHGDGFSGGKLALNLRTMLAQLLEPNAQPPGLRGISRRAGEALAGGLPAADPFSFEGIDRRTEMQKVLRLPEPDADVVSCGLLPVVLFLGGLLLARLRSRAVGAELVLLLGAGTVLFGLSLYGLLQWHSYSFRFWTLVAPWMAVAAAWGLEALPRGLRTGTWLLVAAGTAAVFWHSTLHTYQSGWQAVVHPERALSYSVFAQTRGWARTLAPAGGTLHVALPVNRPLAAFMRTGTDRRVELQALSALPATAAAAVQSLDGWLVVPARHFAGREGGVEKRTWLFYGDEKSPFSLAAYRRPGVTP
ncbi:MAG: hypothetical protein HYV75_06185 [Opitutae bacterium]|nr:hypothetical protein [Opitutae bacterium]